MKCEEHGLLTSIDSFYGHFDTIANPSYHGCYKVSMFAIGFGEATLVHKLYRLRKKKVLFCG